MRKPATTDDQAQATTSAPTRRRPRVNRALKPRGPAAYSNVEHSQPEPDEQPVPADGPDPQPDPSDNGRPRSSGAPSQAIQSALEKIESRRQRSAPAVEEPEDDHAEDPALADAPVEDAAPSDDLLVSKWRMIAQALYEHIPEAAKRRITVPFWLLRIIGDGTDAIIAECILYWTSPGRGHSPNTGRGLPHYWTAKSLEWLAGHTGLPPETVRRSLERLRRQGLIDWQVRKFSNVRQRHIWVVVPALEARYRQVMGIPADQPLSAPADSADDGEWIDEALEPLTLED